MKYLELFEEYIKKDFGYINKDNFINAMNIKTIDECVDYVIENCTEFINKTIRIKRYLSKHDFSFQSEPVERVSRDNANHYTILLDNIESWKEYPKRSKSFICTLLSKTVYSVGFLKDRFFNSYLVIPNDNSKWGVLRSEDIFYTFNFIEEYSNNIKEFFIGMNELSYLLDLGGISDNNITELKDDFMKMQIYIYKNFNDYTVLEKHIRNIVDTQILDLIELRYDSSITKLIKFFKNFWGKNIFDSLAILFDPKKNDIKMVKYIDLERDIYDHEIWTDSPCIFILYSDIEKFLIKLGEKINKKIEL